MQIIKCSEKLRTNVIFLISLLCMSLFLYTGYSKLLDHQRFFNGLTRVVIIGPYALYISWGVPVAELLIAILLSIPRTLKWGLYGFAWLVTIFTLYIISMVLWAAKLPCHCGGAIEQLSWTQHIWFNLAFIVMSVFALWLGKLKTNHKFKKNMKNFRKIALALVVGAIAIGFSAFTSAHNKSIKVTRNAKGQIINVTTYFYNKDGDPADQRASNFIYKDPSVDPDAGCTSGSQECQAQWMTSSVPTNNQSPTAAGSPSYVGNGQEIGPYNGL